MGVIKLEGIEVYAYHGVSHQEQFIGNLYEVDVEIQVNDIAAEETDRIEDTIDYKEVYDLVISEMDSSSKLLEHAASRIYKAIKGSFPQVVKLKISITKYNPPVGGKCRKSTYILEK